MPNRFTLIVEDDRDELDTILSALASRRPAGDVVVAADGDEALYTLFSLGNGAASGLGVPDLLVIDHDAPRVRELQLPVLVRSEPRTAVLPIVTLVGSPVDVCRARDGRLVSDWFVRKPCGVLALGGAIEAACARHMLRPEPLRSHAAR